MSAVGSDVPRALVVLAIAVASLVSGCGNGGQTSTQSTQSGGATPACGGALKGQTYAVCGRLSTAPFPGSTGTTTLLGNLDAGASGKGSTYAIEGGTFHAGQ